MSHENSKAAVSLQSVRPQLEKQTERENEKTTEHRIVPLTDLTAKKKFFSASKFSRGLFGLVK